MDDTGQDEIVKLLRGALVAQENREKEAGKLCGIPWEEWGCAWPMMMAETVNDLREKLKSESWKPHG